MPLAEGRKLPGITDLTGLWGLLLLGLSQCLGAVPYRAPARSYPAVASRRLVKDAAASRSPLTSHLQCVPVPNTPLIASMGLGSPVLPPAGGPQEPPLRVWGG